MSAPHSQREELLLKWRGILKDIIVFHDECVQIDEFFDAALKQQDGPDDVAKDAARYRWLRDASMGQWEHPIVVEQKRVEKGMAYTGPLCGASLDRLIDAAIPYATEEGGK